MCLLERRNATETLDCLQEPMVTVPEDALDLTEEQLDEDISRYVQG